MLRDAQRGLHHVKYPNDVGLVRAGERLIDIGTIVFVIVEPLRVETAHLTTTRHEPQTLPLNQRRAANPLQWPVVDAASLKLFTTVLPKKTAIRDVKTDQTSKVHRRGVSRQPTAAVVGTDIDSSVENYRVAVGLRAELGDPFDVTRAGRLPCASFEIEAADVPIYRNVSVMAPRHS